MAAALTVTPTGEVQVGDTLVVTGTGFLPNTTVSLTIGEEGVTTQVKTDAGGSFSTTDLADPATATLTSDGTNVTAADTVTIGAITYTFRASVSTTANEVKIGADAATTLANLKKAINLSGTGGTEYGSDTVVHPTVGASTLTATTLLLYAKTGGTGGNSLASTEASTHLSFGGATFSGGAASTGISSLLYVPEETEPLHLSATDGTNTATLVVHPATQ